MDETDLMVRLEMLDNMKGDFNAAQTSLEKLDLMELASDARALFDEAFVEVKSKLSRELVSLQRKNTDANSTTVRHSLGDTTSSGNIILWRDSPADEIKAYKLDTLTYGTKSAAFLAIRTMHQLALDEEENFPIGSRIVRTHFYVDDLMSGGDSIEEVVEIKRQVKLLLSRGQFPIRKWCSNEPAVLDGEPEVDKEKLLTFDDGTGIAKALGLTITIPKLELSAALVLAELVSNIAHVVPVKCDYHCWSDSTIALSWIRESPSEFNVFVSNRVAKIQELTQGMSWHHVPTSCNPADILSRGCTPKELMSQKLWQHGPQFLRAPNSEWPANVLPEVNLPERRRKVLITTTKSDLSALCKYQNSFASLQRVFAYIRRFWLLISNKQTETSLKLTVEDLRMGTYLLIRNIQEVTFAVDYAMLSSKKSLSAKSEYALNLDNI
ncbi:hypothetical protein ACLKA7_002727 [Drosophila subpalustris]